MVILSLSPLRARKSDNYRYRYRDSWKRDTLKRKLSKKKQRTDTKKDAKRIKSDNFTRSIRKESNISIAILGNELLDGTIIISYFGGSNNIFADNIILFNKTST